MNILNFQSDRKHNKNNIIFILTKKELINIDGNSFQFEIVLYSDQFSVLYPFYQ